MIQNATTDLARDRDAGAGSIHLEGNDCPPLLAGQPAASGFHQEREQSGFEGALPGHYEAETIDLNVERCFDKESVHQYRRIFYNRHPGHDETQSDLEFLRHWGYVTEAGGKLAPTRAAILLFGSNPAYQQLSPGPIVDMQWINRNWADPLPDERWANRLVIEVNLVKAWKLLISTYLLYAEVPFSIDPETFQRNDLPPDYTAVREAAINLLVHQDYARRERMATIQFCRDRMLFRNPGNAFASPEALLEPGEKKVRNPQIVDTFRRIGLSEQAGTGIPSIFRNREQLGYVPPVIKNDRTQGTFELTLLKESILSNERTRLQAGPDTSLNDTELRVFAFACREGRLRLQDVCALTGLADSQAQTVLVQLTTKSLISPLEGTNPPAFAVAEHLT